MKTHTTNYKNTFIAVADDCPAIQGEMPPLKGDSRSVANLQFELVSKNPYRFTSDDLLFRVYAERNDLAESELETARAQFFSKGQPCLRASPLTKRYGWGVHNDSEGRIAIYGRETDSYENLKRDPALQTVKAMNSKKS